MPGKFFQDVDSALSKGKKALRDAGFIINDDKGNAINLPINEQAPIGIYRTYLSPQNKSSFPTTAPLIGIAGSNGKKYPQGFTPEEAFFVSDRINEKSGLPIEFGDTKTNVSINNNTSVGKIHRTDVNLLSTPLGIVVPGGGYALVSNVPDNSNVSTKSNQGWTDPYFYIQHKDRVNSKTGLPLELGETPYGIDPYFKSGSTGSNSLINPSSPYDILYGGHGRPGVDKIYNLFRNNEQFNFVHNLDISESTGANRIPQYDSFAGNYPENFKTIHLGSKFFLNTSSDNEDPIMFGYDIEILYSSSPLFNGSIMDFINKFKSDTEISARADIWATFCQQFFKYFKVDQIVDNNYSRQNISSIKNPSNEQINKSTDLNKQQGDFQNNPDRVRQSQIENNASNIQKTTEENKAGNPVGKMAEVKTLADVIVAAKKKPLNWNGEEEGKYVKTYYLKKISGLENLIEKDVSVNSDTIKSMIDYGKDMIKISLYDDVSINTGYLASLYKSLSWSRLNGKQIIPENLLRFDAKIKVTEIRQFNRVVKSFNDDNSLDVFPDLISRYEYTLYDCQFIFNEMSHGGEIDMSSPKLTDDFNIGFNYKYSTMAFDKFVIRTGASGSIVGNLYRLDNRLKLSMMTKTKDANDLLIVDNQLVPIYSPQRLTSYEHYPKVPINNGKTGALQDIKADSTIKSKNVYRKYWNDKVNSEAPKRDDGTDNPNTLNNAKKNDMTRKLFEQLGNKLKKAAIREVNRQITTQARLLNKTLDNIRNSIGLGRMSEPTNVYKDIALKNDIRNAFREFIGDSVRGFFSSE